MLVYSLLKMYLQAQAEVNRMEVVNVIKDLISNVGFPILAFLLMYKQNKDLSSTVAENTKVMTELVTTVKAISNRSGEDG